MMNDGTKTIDLYLDGMRCERCVQKLSQAISEIEGVEEYEVEIGHARISYLPQLSTPEGIKHIAETTGYTAHFQTPRKNKWKKFLDRMIQSNERVFGNERPDCCSLNNNQKHYR
jgi:copper chaperone CopZ